MITRKDDIMTHNEVINVIKSKYTYDEFCELIFEVFEDEFGNLQGVKDKFNLEEK